MKKVNRKRRTWKRKPSEFARIYGSRARVRFVKELGCGICGARQMIENAHIKTGGTGRKGDYDQIVPLCRLHHQYVHDYGIAYIGRLYGVDFTWLAAHTESLWQRHLATRTA